MKKLLFLAFIITAVISCEEKPKDYVTFSGQITDKNSDSLLIRSYDRPFYKVIHVDDDGSFKDTLAVEKGVYNLYDGGEYTDLFLENGDNIHMTLNTNHFDESVSYTGEGSQNSNFIAEKYRLQGELLDLDALKRLDSTALAAKFSNIRNELEAFYTSNKSIDSSLVDLSIQEIDPLLQQYRTYLNQALALKTELPKGAKSPTFEDYENYNGGTTSLSDLRGSYVYVDVWATWCGPCKVEIPSLKSVEEAYSGKNIQFVSISIDDNTSHNSWDEAKESWKNMVKDKDLKGIQLFATNGGRSEFLKEYKISGIPRFILIDPEGNIVDADAPRPSEPALKDLFNELNI